MSHGLVWAAQHGSMHGTISALRSVLSRCEAQSNNTRAIMSSKRLKGKHAQQQRPRKRGADGLTSEAQSGFKVLFDDVEQREAWRAMLLDVCRVVSRYFVWLAFVVDRCCLFCFF